MGDREFFFVRVHARRVTDRLEAGGWISLCT